MRDRNLYAICHGDGLTGNILHIIHIDEIGPVAADKLFVIFQLFAQIIQSADTVQYFSILAVEQKCPSHHLTILQSIKVQSGNSGSAAQDQAVFLIFVAFRKYRIHQAVKTFLPDRLQLVEISAYRIRIHSILCRRCQIDNLYRSIILPDFHGRTDTVLRRHQHIQKNNIQPRSSLHFRQQLQRTVK